MFLRMLAVCTYAAVLWAQTGTEYGGPSVLSRGMAASVTARHANIDFRPRIGISGICDNGLTAVSIDAQGRAPNKIACGVEANAGISGYHMWRKTRLGLDYSGNYRHYPREAFYDGIDQLLALGVSHQLSRRVAFSFRESGGTYSRNYFGLDGAGFFDPSALQTPANNLFDSPVYFGSTAADMTYTLSRRWSVNMGGNAFAVRYRSGALYGTTSYGAHGDMVYRYSRYGSIGVAYQYLHADFTRSFGNFDYHSLGLLYSLRLSRSWELELQAGAGRVESLTLERVAVDPAIAAITGQTSGVLAAYHLNYFPDLSAGLTKAFRNSSLNFRYSRTISAGNGAYLASEADTGVVSYGYTGVRHWSFTASAGYNRLRALQQQLGAYEGYTAGIGLSRTLGKGVQFVMRIDERHQSIHDAHFRRDVLRASMGFMWSPGDIPLSLW